MGSPSVTRTEAWLATTDATYTADTAAAGNSGGQNCSPGWIVAIFLTFLHFFWGYIDLGKFHHDRTSRPKPGNNG